MDNTITIFSTPRPFRGPFDVIQKNSIRSWIKECPECEIILFEDEEHTTLKVAEELGVRCITGVVCNEFGTPLLNDVYKKVKEISNSKVIVHINTDIILLDGFLSSIKQVLEIMKDKPFFMSGRRWDLDLNQEIDFNQINWKNFIQQKLKKNGKLHGPAGMDYWILPINFPFEIPPFIIARPGMDSWLVYKSRTLKIPVIDSTDVINIVHQNHNYPKKKNAFYEVERKRNLKMAGGFMNVFTLREANFILKSQGLFKPKFPRKFFSDFATFYPWRVILLLKRIITSFIEGVKNKKQITKHE